ncbi:outer membrane protein transport protein [bacterium]|nr:outer membrane protein transport protein [candidate division CSSED10-310 bacterium]
MINKLCLASIALICIMTTDALAQSPFFSWASPRSMALGGVSTTGFDEPATMHLNPASLVEIDRLTVSSGLAVTLLDETVTVDGQSPIDNRMSPAIAPNLTTAVNFGSRLISAGISLNTFDSYRLSLPSDSLTRYQGTDLTLFSGGLDVALGFMPIRDLSFGIKLGLLAATAKWNRRISPFNDDPDPEFDMHWSLDMNALSDYSVLFGTTWSAGYRFKAGLTYRPQMRYRFDATIENELPEVMGGEVITSKIRDLSITIPQEIRLGFHWLATERMDLYMDVGWTENSKIDSITLKADDPKPPYIDATTTIPVRLKDVWHGHLGIEYMASGFFTLRAGGFYYNRSGRPEYESTMIPETAHFGVTTGVGFHFFEWDLDASAGWIDYETVTMSGTALPFPLDAEKNVSRYVGAVSVRYHF